MQCHYNVFTLAESLCQILLKKNAAKASSVNGFGDNKMGS
jgi:hypothetical protein